MNVVPHQSIGTKLLEYSPKNMLSHLSFKKKKKKQPKVLILDYPISEKFVGNKPCIISILRTYVRT